MVQLPYDLFYLLIMFIQDSTISKQNMHTAGSLCQDFTWNLKEDTLLEKTIAHDITLVFSNKYREWSNASIL